MLGRSVTLFRVLGFAVRVDASWLAIAVLVTWSLAQGLFPHQQPGLTQGVYWAMGVTGAVGLFASIIFHELSHSLVARRYALPITGITLFIFGGVAEMSEEPRSAAAEFFMAIAGPLASMLLAVLFYGLYSAGEMLAVPPVAITVIGYLALVNGMLAAFNMIPAFPLDGGRVARAALWAWKGSIRWATRVVAAIGSGFGMVLIGLGIYAVMMGGFITGMWWALIGLFLHGAARSSYQQLIVREHLQGEPVRRFMTSEPTTVTSDTDLQTVVDDILDRYSYKRIPVVDGRELRGCLSAAAVRQVPGPERVQRRVAELVEPCSGQNTIEADQDVLQALQLMQQHDVGRLMVVDDGRLVGMLGRRDLMAFLSQKLDLDDG